MVKSRIYDEVIGGRVSSWEEPAPTLHASIQSFLLNFPEVK